jgi:hypothetical protein
LCVESTLRIDRQEAIQLLLNSRSLRHLDAFQRTARTATQAARFLGVSASNVSYWIPKLVRAGLIQQMGRVGRAGTPMPVYKATAHRYLVPLSAVDHGTRQRFIDASRSDVLAYFADGYDEALLRHPLHIAFEPFGERGTTVNLDQPSLLTDAIDTWTTLRLSRSEARELAQRIAELIAEFSDRHGPHPYTLHAGLARTPRHRNRSATSAIDQ